MLKYIVVIFAAIACAAARPGILAPFAYSAPVVATPGVVTATSSQVIARNYNGIVAAPIVAAAPVATPFVAAPFAGNYVAAPFAAPLGYSAPFAAPLRYSVALDAAPLGYTAPAPVLL